MADELTPWEDETLQHFLALGREVADTAVTLRATYVSAHVRIGEGQVVAFSCDDGTVWANGLGFEVELSRLRGW